jgi:hypothetical protein
MLEDAPTNPDGARVFADPDAELDSLLVGIPRPRTKVSCTRSSAAVSFRVKARA